MVFVFAFLKLLFVEYTISYPSAFSAAAQDTEIFLLLLAFANFTDKLSTDPLPLNGSGSVVIYSISNKHILVNHPILIKAK